MNHTLHEPTLLELCSVFQNYLSQCFRVVSCSVVPCPDLTVYHLTTKGLGGTRVLCDVGSFDYLLPSPDMTKRYNTLDLFNVKKMNDGVIIGAAAGPHFLSGISSELVVNLNSHDGRVLSNGSYCGSYDEKNHSPVSSVSDSSEFAMLGQMLLCEGKPGEVIELNASERTRDGKFDALLRDALRASYGTLERPVGVGGVVVQLQGKCQFHVLPQFCAEPLDSPEKVKNWLKFFEMDAPVVSVGTVLSHDPQNWKLRLEHFHCFNLDRTKCGHCHFDTDPKTASYKAYLVPGQSLIRVDPPH